MKCDAIQALASWAMLGDKCSFLLKGTSCLSRLAKQITFIVDGIFFLRNTKDALEGCGAAQAKLQILMDTKGSLLKTLDWSNELRLEL